MLCYITMSAFKIVLFIRVSVGIASMEWVMSHMTDSPNIATDKHQTHITTPVSIGTAKPKPKYIPCHFQFLSGPTNMLKSRSNPIPHIPISLLLQVAQNNDYNAV